MKIVGYRRLSSLIFISLICAASALAQSSEPSQPKSEVLTDRSAEQNDRPKKSPSEKLAGDEPASVTGETKKLSEAEQQSLRRESQSEDEAEPLHYMNNWFKTYRLGPEDVITVDVFGMPQYTRSGIIVPPDGKISYPLIGHVKVVGRTTEDIEKELTERLAEYIIEPKVSVQLVNARSQKVIVDGDVGKPGVYEMTRRMTVQEAIAMAGPVLRTGSKTGVRLLRQRPNGERQIYPINLKQLEQGKGEDLYLVPGDIIIVPGNRFATIEKWMSIVSMATWGRMILR